MLSRVILFQCFGFAVSINSVNERLLYVLCDVDEDDDDDGDGDGGDGGDASCSISLPLAYPLLLVYGQLALEV